MKKIFYILLVLNSITINAQNNSGWWIKDTETRLVIKFNEYRKQNFLKPLNYTKAYWEWSYNQSYYLSNLYKSRLSQNNFDPIGNENLKLQKVDLEGYKELERTIIPAHILQEQVLVLFVSSEYPEIRGKSNPVELSNWFFEQCINLRPWNDFLLNQDATEISISIYKTTNFIVVDSDKKYNVHIITIVANIGN